MRLEWLPGDATKSEILHRCIGWSYIAEVARPNGVKAARRTLAANTKLSRRLHGVEQAARTEPLDALRRARRTFLAGERLDMGALAAELSVDRATLFRWVGNRDQLLAEVIWSVAEPTFRHAVAEAGGTGARRVVEVLSRFIRAVLDAPFFAAYLRREPERALRVLTTKATLFQQRLITEVDDLLVAEKQASGLRYPLPTRDLAYVVVRISESFIYADVIADQTPDPDKAAAALSALLGIGPGENPREE